ncbi:ATP-binding protein [Streptomyces scabiei]|uniref:ATP-binding protein n=1 Tax=Streptomyces scabiei TaxID=1930 RepID=UPI0007658CBB|nr:ATP-binding protein [Streptomyces scabiei]
MSDPVADAVRRALSRITLRITGDGPGIPVDSRESVFHRVHEHGAGDAGGSATGRADGPAAGSLT